MSARGSGKTQIQNTKLQKETGRTRTTVASKANNMAGTTSNDKHEENEDNGDAVPLSSDLKVILGELRDFRRETKTQLEGITEEVKKTNTRMDEAEARIEGAEGRIQNTENVMVEMLRLQTQIDAKLADLEGRSRRENIRIYGIPEGAEKDSPSMIEFVERLLRENLDISTDTPLQLERAHRALGPQPPATASPRSIVVKFLSFRTKEMVLRAGWRKKDDFTWRGKKINLDNDYAPRVLQMRREFAEVRKVLKDSGIQFQTMYPARLKAKYTDGTIIYESVEEATKDMAKRGLQIRAIEPPESLMEQLRRLTWQTAGPRRTRASGSARPRGGPGYKEKLQNFRRGQPPTDGHGT